MARQTPIRQEFVAEVESLDLEGRGVAHRDGKVVFIEGALPGECVRYERVRNKPSYETGRTLAVDAPLAPVDARKPWPKDGS